MKPIKLYANIDYKDKHEISGSIFNRTRNVKDEIYIRFKATRHSEIKNIFELDLYRRKDGDHITVTLDETFDCSMTKKDILFYVEQRIEHIWKQL